MTLQERSDIVLAFTRLLYVNGQSTDDTLTAAERLSRHLGLRTTVIPRWGELELDAGDRRNWRWPACAIFRTGIGTLDCSDSVGSDLAVHARGGGGRCGTISSL